MLVEFGGVDGTYQSCRKVELEIPVRKAQIASTRSSSERAKLPLMQRIGAFVNDRSDYVRAERGEPRLGETFAAPAAAASPNVAAKAPEHQFMLGQLLSYKPLGTPYSTVRFELTRAAAHGPADPASAPTIVHVYESHWADLSRLGQGIARVFGAIHQLLIHLSNLGRKEVDYAFIEFNVKGKEAGAWKRFSTVNGYAVRAFGFIPVLNLVMVMALASVLATEVPKQVLTFVAVSLAAIAAAAVIGVAAFRRGKKNEKGRGTEWRTSGYIGLLVAMALIVVAVATAVGTINAGLVLLAEWWLIMAAGSDALLRWYDPSRPGALAIGRIVTILAAASFVVGIVIARGDAAILSPVGTGAWDRGAVWHAALWTFAALGVVAFGLWLLFFAFALVAACLSFGAWLIIPAVDNEARIRGYRATATSRLTMAISALLYLVSTVFAIALLGSVAAKGAPYLDHPSLGVIVTRVWPAFPQPRPQKLCDALSHIVEQWIPPSAVTPILFGFGAFVLVSWVVVLVAYTETHTFKTSSYYDRRLGNWLSRGFSVWDVWVTSLIEIAILAWLPGAVVVQLVEMLARHQPYFSVSTRASLSFVLLEYVGAAAASAGVGLLALRTQLANLAQSLRTPLGIVLDVDNYLRESPVDRTPRAQIVERFVSLLRYVHRWRDSEKSDGPSAYDAVVIVSHSQGTVIATDTLRFVRTEGDAALQGLGLAGPHDHSEKRTPLRLMTFGSPLRQLYGARFPHLYSWAIGRPKSWEPYECALADSPHCPAADDLPAPASLGTERWTNVYMSGDYVGRRLWLGLKRASAWLRYDGGARGQRRGRNVDPPLTIVQDTTGPAHRREMCLGAGAHTHYWIHPEVAAELDLLIAP